MARRRWPAGCRDEIDVHKELHEATPDALDRYELDVFNHAKKRRNGRGHDDDLNTLTDGVGHEREQCREN
jgi:hypothetical protein